jgi:hypothetical protein
MRITHAIHGLRSNKYRLSQFDRNGITYLAWLNEPTGLKKWREATLDTNPNVFFVRQT